MKKALLVSVFFIFYFQAYLSYAQSDDSNTFVLTPISILGAQPSTTESTITSKEISRNNSVDLAQALDNQLGIFNYSKGPIANDIVINGLNRDNINVLVDGARIYGACPSRMDAPAFHVPLNDVQTIKIIYGPFDVTHQGSMGGLVDIKTLTPKLGFHSNFSFNGNSYGFVNPNVEASYNSGKFYIVGGYSFKTSEPYKDARGTKITDYIPNEYKSTPSHDFKIASYFTKIGFTPTDDTDISLSYLKQVSEDVLYPFLSMDDIYDRSNIATFSVYKGDINNYIKNLDFKLYYSNVYHLMSNEYRYTSNNNLMSTYASTQAYGGSMSLDLNKTTLGIDSYKRSWYAERNQMPMMPRYMIPDVFITNVGIFAKRNFDLANKLTLKAGLRVDTTESKPDNSLENSNNKQNPNYFKNFQMLYNSFPGSKTDTYPSGYLKLDYELNQHNVVSFGFGHGVRVPDPEERYIYNMSNNKLWVGNPSLDSAQNNELNLGFNGDYNKIKINIDAYYRYIRNYITLTQLIRNNTTYVLYQNTNAYMYGFNFGINYNPFSNFFISSGTSYVTGYQETDQPKHIGSSNLPDMPPLREVISLKYDRDPYFAEIQTIIASRQYNVDTDLGEQKAPGYTLVNLKGGFKYKNLNIVLGIDNVLNHEYYAYNDYYSNPFNTGVKLPEPGRTFYINTSYSF